LVLLRHGRTAWNLERRFQGQSDIELDDLGRAQAVAAARHLSQLRPSRIVASDLARAADTARALSAECGVDVELDQRLREMFAGSWEGMLGSDLHGDDVDAWRRGEDVPAGGGETRTDVAKRAMPVVDEVADGLGDDQVAVLVTHGGTIRGILGGALGLPYEHWRVLGGLANCCWSIIELGGNGWRLTEHNAGSLPEVVIGDDE
jgi:glucosyl-3-phosphoglycerate phosphatase